MMILNIVWGVAVLMWLAVAIYIHYRQARTLRMARRHLEDIRDRLRKEARP